MVDTQKANQMLYGGQITPEQHQALMQLMAVNWQSLLQLFAQVLSIGLPALSALIPGLAPFLPIISWVISILTGGTPSPLPIPTPTPTPSPSPVPTPIPGGGGNIPTP